MRHTFFLVALLGFVLCHPVEAAITLTDLGSLGGDTTLPYALNNKGEVVGMSKNSNAEERAFLWRSGVMTDLGAGVARDINDHSHIVGQLNGFGFLLRDGIVTSITSPYGGIAHAVNNSDMAVGIL